MLSLQSLIQHVRGVLAKVKEGLTSAGSVSNQIGSFIVEIIICCVVFTREPEQLFSTDGVRIIGGDWIINEELHV